MSSKKTLSPSPSMGLTRGLLGKLAEMVVEHGLAKSPVFRNSPTAQVDEFIKSNGLKLRDAFVEMVERQFMAFIKKVSGIIIPVCAQSTGLVPNGWKVRNDDLEGEISLNNLDYSSGPVQVGDGDFVEGSTMLARAGNAYGSLGFAAALLKAQAEGKEIFPVESRSKHYFIMPRTILLDGRRRRRVAYFDWGGGSWVLNFGFPDYGFGGGARFVRPPCGE